MKEDNPLWYSVLLNDFYEEVHGYRLNHLDYYTEWIKPHGWCHKVILEREQLNYCTHVMGVEPPPETLTLCRLEEEYYYIIGERRVLHPKTQNDSHGGV